MRNAITRRFVLVLAVAVAGAASMARAQEMPAAQNDDDRECSVASLRGLYLFEASGYDIVAGAAQPKAILEEIRFTGDGNLTVPAATVSRNGTILHAPANGTGTYVVASDCTGTLAFPAGPTFDLYLAPKGVDFSMIQTNPNSVLQGRVIRLSR